MSTADRFWAKVEKTDTCWLWTGALNSRGYGCFAVGGVSQLAHRVSYQALNGAIPDGLTIDHLCCVKHCVRPSHLEAVTLRENCQRYARTIERCRHCGAPLTSRKRSDKRATQRHCQPCANRRAREKRAAARSAL